MDNFSAFLARRILMTLGYSQAFGFPLTSHEIWVRLLVKSTHTTQGVIPVVTESQVVTVLQPLVHDGVVGVRDNHYFFAGHETTVVDRKKQTALSQVKWMEVQSFVEQIRHIPWIQGVAVTGSLAVDSTHPGDDIDFMIVTSANRLWLSRVWISWLAQLQGKRRSWKREDLNSWCFNLWLSEDRLRMPIALQTVYGAYELCQAKWVYSRPGSGVAMTFLKENSWAKWYVPNYYASKKYDASSAIEKSTREEGGKSWSMSISTLVEAVFNLPLTIINLLFYSIQFSYMKSHMTRERVSLHSAFFHPRNTKHGIYELWSAAVREVGQ